MGRASYEEALGNYGDWNIEKLRVVRAPLARYQQAFARGAAALNPSKLDGQPVDNFFHTFTEAAVRNPTTGERHVVLLEKNQTLNAKVNRSGGLHPSHDALNVDTSKWGAGGRTLAGYEAKHAYYHENRLGKDFEDYDVRNNNCQVYTQSGLVGNGVSTPETRSFVNQPIEQVIPNWFGVALKPLTSVAAVTSNLYDYLFPSTTNVANRGAPRGAPSGETEAYVESILNGDDGNG